MRPEPDDLRARVLSHFERHREMPGASFEEERFLDYLLANPAGSRAAYNSFEGLRRLNQLIEAIQLEFAVCFSMADRDQNYALDQLVGRIRDLQASRQSSLASLRNRKKHRFGWTAVIFGNLLAFPLWMAGFHWTPVAGWALLGICIAATAMMVRLYVADKRYLRTLEARIVESAKNGI